MTAIDRDQALAALKDAPGIWNFNDLEDGEPCITVADAVSLLESVAALPAIPLDDELRDEIMQLVDFHLDPLLAANRDFRDDLSQVLSARGALPVLETKKETE